MNQEVRRASLRTITILAAMTALGCHPKLPTESGDAGQCVAEHIVPVHITDGEEPQVATMTLRTSATQIEITLDALPERSLGDAYVAIEVGSRHTSLSANETPWVDGYPQSIHFAIPLDDASLACGDVFTLVVRARVKYDGVGDLFWASALGAHRLDPAHTGWKHHYTVCCGEPPRGEGGCTLTQGYWKNHPDAWPVDALVIGGRSYTKSELLAILATPPRGDASLVLAHQLIAARLNVANGAGSITAIADADAWMAARGASSPHGVSASSAAGGEAIALAEALAAFNEGREGPGHCDDRDRGGDEHDDGQTPGI